MFKTSTTGFYCRPTLRVLNLISCKLRVLIFHKELTNNTYKLCELLLLRRSI